MSNFRNNAAYEKSSRRPWQSLDLQTTRKPLVDFCTNEWRDNPKKSDLSYDPDALPSTHVSFEGWTGIIQVVFGRRRARGVIAILSLCCLISLLFYVSTLDGSHTSSSSKGLAAQIAKQPPSGKVFGSNHRPSLTGVKQVSTLDTSLLPVHPSGQLERPGRRLIFIGDIHGCFEELSRLLIECQYNRETDHIVTTGDMVNKGPSSGAVLDFLLEHGASCVRGNHDDRILLKATQEPDVFAANGLGHKSQDAETQLAMSLTQQQLAYLQSCPIILRVGDVPSYGNVVVVHGGLVPSVAIEDQDPWAVMNMRIMHKSAHIPSKDHEREGYQPWSEVWGEYSLQQLSSPEILNDYEGRIDAKASMVVIYGHDAKQGLRIEKFTKGLDSGCVSGRHLSALVVGGGSHEELYQVDCKRYV